MFLASLAFGTIGFWITFTILAMIVTILVETESGTWATLIMAGSIVGFSYVCKWSLLVLVKMHPVHALEMIGIYLLIGIAWSIIKWYFYLRKSLRKYNENKAKFLESEEAENLTPELANDFHSRYYYGTNRVVPSAKDHRGDFIRWSTYWPFSFIGTMLNDVVRKIYSYAYELLQGTYQKMADHIFKGTLDDRNIAIVAKMKEKEKKK